MSAQPASAMVDVFVERRFPVNGAATADLPDGARVRPCLDLHRAQWQASFIALNGDRLMCHFRAPDAESLRLALHSSGIAYDTLWASAVQPDYRPGDIDLVVERSFASPLSRADEAVVQALTARRLAACGAAPSCVLLSRCRRRLVCLCRAGDVDTASRIRARLIEPSFEVWACETSLPTPDAGRPLEPRGDRHVKPDFENPY